MSSFKQRSVLVTGAGRGVGKRLALGFAQEGARVGLLSRSKQDLEVSLIEIQQRGGQGVVLPADVRDAAAVQRQADAFGVADVLICAAGIQGPIAPLAEADLASWTDTIDTNLIGLIHCIRAVLPQMAERRRGKIIVLSGGGSTRARRNFSAYATAKTAALRLVETVAEEVMDDNIQINALSPGGTYTSMTDEILEAGEAAGQNELQEARQIRITGGIAVERQMELAMFLASESSNHISGRLIHINDEWKRLDRERLDAHMFMLRRVQKSTP